MPKASGGGGKASASDVRAGGAFIELFGKDGLSGVLDKAQKKVATFSAFLSRVSRTTAFAGATLAAPLALLFKGGMDRAAETARLAQQFQVPIDLMSRLQYAAEQAGVSVDEVMKDTEGRFGALIDKAPVLDPQRAKQALETQMAFKDATIALQYAMLPLLDVVTPLVKEVANFVKENAAAVRVIAAVAAGLLGLSVATAALGPALSLLVGGGGLVVRLTAGLFSLVKILTAVRIATMLSAVKVAALATVKFLWLVATVALSSALSLLTGAVAFLLSPIGMLTAAALVLAYVFRAELRDAGTEIAKHLGDMFREIGETFGVMFGGIVNAVKAGDLELAFRIMGQGVKTFWAQLLEGLAQAWNAFVAKVAESVKKNKWLVAAVGGVTGAGAGFMVGGPWGALLGLAGGATGGYLAADFADDIAAAIKVDVGGLKGDAKAERAKLDALAKQAANAAAKPVAVPDYLKYQMGAAKGFDAVKGSFQTYQTARQQFGYGDAVKQQTELQKRIANAAEDTAKGVEKLNNALEMK